MLKGVVKSTSRASLKKLSSTPPLDRIAFLGLAVIAKQLWVELEIALRGKPVELIDINVGEMARLCGEALAPRFLLPAADNGRGNDFLYLYCRC